MSPGSSLILFALGSVLFGVLSYRARFLDRGGALAGALFAFSLLSLGGLAWAIPAFGFFAGSSLLSRMGRRRKAAAHQIAEKGSIRDVSQVLSNGGVSWLLLLIHGVHEAPVLYWGFLGSLAAATADTWGTEIGTFFRGRPRLITTGRAVPPGTSGAVSVQGTLGSLAGALFVWSLAVVIPYMHSSAGLLIVAGGGFVGALVDSVIGATVQASYVDAITGKATERSHTDGKPNRLASGHKWMDNDRVNLLCTFAGAAVSMFLYFLVAP